MQVIFTRILMLPYGKYQSRPRNGSFNERPRKEGTLPQHQTPRWTTRLRFNPGESYALINKPHQHPPSHMPSRLPDKEPSLLPSTVTKPVTSPESRKQLMLTTQSGSFEIPLALEFRLEQTEESESLNEQEFQSTRPWGIRLPHYGDNVLVDGGMVESNSLSRILYARPRDECILCSFAEPWMNLLADVSER